MPNLKSEIERSSRLFNIGKFSKAIAICSKAIKLYPEAQELLLIKADSCQMLHRYQEAKRTYQKLLEQDPKNSKYHYNYAALCLATGSTEQAKAHLETSLQLQPNFALASGLLAEVYVRLEDFDSAEKFIQLELSKYKADIESRAGLAYLLAAKAQILIHRQQAGQAHNLLRQAVMMDKANCQLLEKLSHHNPEAGTSSKIFSLAVKGKALCPGGPSFSACTYLAGFEVVANSREEALEYVKEIECLAEPESLDITRCYSRPNKWHRHCGVVFVAPSVTIDAISRPPHPRLKSALLQQNRALH